MQDSEHDCFVTPSAHIQKELLFFDTFSHSSSENNFDLVQFPSPIIVDLIKIVPLGQPVEAKIPGNVRLGATNPSNCELEFFINDLTKHDAHTLTDLGKFCCDVKTTDFIPTLQIQTDGLLLRGNYRTLTLAIFGRVITFEEKHNDEQTSISSPAQTPVSPVGEERDTNFIINSKLAHSLNRDSPDHMLNLGSDVFDQASIRSDDTLKDRMIEESDRSENHEDNNASYINSSNLHEPIDEISSSEGGKMSLYNEKKGDESIHSNDDDSYHKSSRDSAHKAFRNSSEETYNQDHSKKEIDEDDQTNNFCDFDVTKYQPEPLTYFTDPSLTPQEHSIQTEKILKQGDSNYCAAIDKELKRLRDAFEKLYLADGSKSEDWVALIEVLTNDISGMFLSQFLDDEEMLNCLTQELCYGLDFDLALKHKTSAFKVRHLRAGLKLATILFNCGDTAVKTLLKYSIPYKVLQLYEKDEMSLPLKLLIFRCLSAACDSTICLEHITSHFYDWSDTKITINSLKQLNRYNSESKTTSTEHPVFDSVEEPSEGFESSEQVHEDVQNTNHEPTNFTCYQYILRILLMKPHTRITMAIGSIIKKIRLFYDLSKLVKISELFDSEEKIETQDQQILKESIDRLQDIMSLIKNKCSEITQPVRHLPATVQFQAKPYHGDPYIAIYKWIKYFNFLHSIDQILRKYQAPKDNEDLDVEDCVKVQCLCLEFLHSIADSPSGLHLLLSDYCYETFGKILDLLLKKQPNLNSSQIRLDAIGDYTKTSIGKAEELLSKRCNDFALKMIYYLKVYTCIDKLSCFHRDISNDNMSHIAHPENVVHELLKICDHPYGLAAILHHFAIVGNLDCLIKFLDMPTYHKQLEFVKDISIDYSLEIIGTFLKLNNNILEISREYLDVFIEISKTKDKNLSTRIKSLIPWLTPFEQDISLKSISYTEDTFKQLVKVIKNSIPDCSIPFAKGLNFELPPQMITALRMLRQLCVPPQVEQYLADTFDCYSSLKFVEKFKASSSIPFVDSFPHNQNQNLSWNLNNQLYRNENSVSNDNFVDPAQHQNQINQTFKLYQPYDKDIVGELKYHFGIMQTIENNALKRLLNTLRELTGNYPKPLYQSAALCGIRGRIVLNYIDNVLVLIHSIICHLIDARGSDFKDTTVVPVILEIYSLLCFTPNPKSSKIDDSEYQLETHDQRITSLKNRMTLEVDNYTFSQQIKKMILSILMSYTQLCLSVSESEEKVITKSLWTKMVNEVLKFSLSAPVFFHPGIEVLTRLLPAPLPHPGIMDSIDQEQLFISINHRKLWSAHLHPLHSSIEELIFYFSICQHPGIRTSLTYLCLQLCDLSSTSACMVAKTILDRLAMYAVKYYMTTSSPTKNGFTTGDSDSINNVQNINPGNTNSSLLDDKAIPNWAISGDAIKYIMNKILNIVGTLITNKAFDTAFTNYAQLFIKKDEKFIVSIKQVLDLLAESEVQNEIFMSCYKIANNSNQPVTKLIEAMIAYASSTKESFCEVPPPQEMIKINLMELSRKTSDRFSLSSGLKKFYRLKVLLDHTANMHSRSSESTGGAIKRSSDASFPHLPEASPLAKRQPPFVHPTHPPLHLHPHSHSHPRPHSQPHPHPLSHPHPHSHQHSHSHSQIHTHPHPHPHSHPHTHPHSNLHSHSHPHPHSHLHPHPHPHSHPRSRLRPVEPSPPFRSDPLAVPSSFRSRAYSNSSRPASIHVDEFMSNHQVRARQERKYSSSSRYRY